MTTRNVALDYAKGIGILIVVFAHLWRGLFGSGLLSGVDSQVVQALSSVSTIVSMPAFFMASGLLYGANIQKRHGAAELAGKFDGILYPYLIWSLIIGFFEVAGSGLRNGSTALSDLTQIFWNPMGIFWFLYVLLMSFIVVEVIVKIFGAKQAPWILFALSLCLLLVYPYTPGVFCLREFCLSLVYFAAGVFLANRIPKVQFGSWGLLPVSVLALVALEYFTHMVLGLKTGSTRSITPEVFWLGVLSVTLVFLICYSLPSTGLNWLLTLGSRSMDIYLLHLLFVASARIFLDKFLGVHFLPAYLVIGLFLGVMGPLVVTDAMRKTRLKYLLQPPSFLSLKARFSTRGGLKKA